MITVRIDNTISNMLVDSGAQSTVKQSTAKSGLNF